MKENVTYNTYMIDPSQTILLSDDKLFYTLEGEGEYIGQPSVFMRLSMCNLRCPGFASPDSPNGCDSYISWSVKNKYTFQQIWDEFFIGQGFADKLRMGAILKYTGGEPLVQQKALWQWDEFLRDKLYDKFGPSQTANLTDFETNATILPMSQWVQRATFTTSPKLTSNGDPESKTYKPEVLRWHRANHSGFKFVITNDKDIEEIWCKYVEDDQGINVPRNRIWFMPACGSREEHIERAPAVAEYAKAMGVNFSPRLHLLIWNRALCV